MELTRLRRHVQLRPRSGFDLGQGIRNIPLMIWNLAKIFLWFALFIAFIALAFGAICGLFYLSIKGIAFANDKWEAWKAAKAKGEAQAEELRAFGRPADEEEGDANNAGNPKSEEDGPAREVRVEDKSTKS